MGHPPKTTGQVKRGTLAYPDIYFDSLWLIIFEVIFTAFSTFYCDKSGLNAGAELSQAQVQLGLA